MIEYPREIIGGGALIEAFPDVFYAREPEDPSNYDGSRLQYDDFTRASDGLDLARANATRAFNGVFLTLRHRAVEAGIITLPFMGYYGHGKRPNWEFLSSWGDSADAERRHHVLLGTQAVYNIYRDYMDFLTPKQKPIQQYLVLGELFELDEPEPEPEHDAEPSLDDFEPKD